MEFLPFPKIARQPGAGGVSASSGVWVAQEKVHGAQLVAGVDTQGVRFGKRKAWLSEQDTFFGWQLLRVELTALSRRVFSALGLAEGSTVFLYGEFFGGAYPHPGVPSLEGLRPVQTGIWYSPGYQWMVFDAVVLGKEPPNFVGATRLAKALETAGSVGAPVLGKGKLSELLRLPVRFVTKVPPRLGLPEIASNWAEGMVVKPDFDLPITEREVIKRKIEEFDEKVFDESEAWDPNQKLSFEALLAWAERLVNPARVSSARSKVGTDPQALAEEVVLDSWVDLEEAFPAALRALSAAQEEKLRGAMLSKLSALEPKP